MVILLNITPISFIKCFTLIDSYTEYNSYIKVEIIVMILIQVLSPVSIESEMLLIIFLLQLILEIILASNEGKRIDKERKGR